MSAAHGPREPVDAVELRRGARVRLRPSERADIVDLALSGRLARVDRIEHGEDDRVYVVVGLDGDPASDLGPMSQIGHRFFFDPDELEPVGSDEDESAVLVAAVGDAFAVDGAFGANVIERLRGAEPPENLRLADFGIRFADLAHALEDDYEALVIVSAVPHEHEAGAVSVWGVDSSPAGGTGAGRVDPTSVLALARRLTSRCPRVFVVACEGSRDPVPAGELSPPVRRAIDRAARQVEVLVDEIGETSRRSRGGSAR